MNSQPPENSASANLPVSPHTTRVNVPVFNCIIYVRPAVGGVDARVANLPNLVCTAASEREALAKLVPAFKRHVADLLQIGAPIPWIDPPSPAEPGEQTRFVPVHL